MEVMPGGKYNFKPSEGGLATGLQRCINKVINNIWVGWPGQEVDGLDNQDKVAKGANLHNMRPVFLTNQEIKLFMKDSVMKSCGQTFIIFLS